MSPSSQNSKILTRIKTGKTITPIDALRWYGCFRLAARIFELRQMGHDIEKEIEDGHAVYWLPRKARK